MEISKELEKISSKEKTAASIIEDIEQEQQELNRKIHLFKVIHVASIMEDMINTRMFQRYDIQSITIMFSYDYDMGNYFSTEFYDFNGDEIENINGNYSEPIDKVGEAFDILRRFSTNDINEEFRKNGVMTFKIEEGLPNKIIDAFLSKELKAILDYSEMQNNLSKNSAPSKKMKI